MWSNSTPAKRNFLEPGGSTDVPVIGPPDANGQRTVYMTDGSGKLHSLNAADGEDVKPPFYFAGGKGWAMSLVGDTLWMPHRGEISATRLSDPTHKVMTLSAGSGGLWGRRGSVIDSSGAAWTTTGDGDYDPAAGKFANGIIGAEIVGDQLLLKDYFVPRNWEWLRKRDLDPNNTPTIFKYKGRELMAASGKECRVYLLDVNAIGGDDHQTPLFQTPLVCNEEVDFQDMGSWGAVSSWEEANGTRWVLAPFWGPAHSKFKAPIMNTPATQLGGVAAFKVEDKSGYPVLTPVWVSRDMDHGEPPVIANGVVYTFGSGDFTQQASPENGLDFDSSIRAAKARHVTLYALDAQTGRELYSSEDQIPVFNHFSGLTVANGRVYVSTYDGALYCFGLPESQ